MTNNQFTLSDFIVQKVIGEGSYGRAVLCKQISNNKNVVIKEISLKKLTEQEQRDAWKETKVLSLLHHPNIITYYGCFLQNNVLHIVMEYADNGDLSEEIRKSLNNNQHFDEDKILNWFVQICLAIKHLHDRKILHRDLKNQNIFLLKDNTAKLGDFGIAKMLSSTSQMSNTAIGTPYYLSPEICQGKSYNMKSDIWSLGCILYELCTLHHPFDSNCLNGLIVKIQRAKPPPIPYYYSSSLRNLVDKLLQKVPAKRPSINQILELDFIRCRVPNFLSYAIERKEFCHTILHDFKPGESPEKAKVTPEDVENNNANLHFENKKDDNQNRGNRNIANSRNRNNRQGAYRNIPRYSNRNINQDNRRRVNKDEEVKSPRLQYRNNASPQISQQQDSRRERNNGANVLIDYDQQSEEESVKSNEIENYLGTDESSELNEDNYQDANYHVNNVNDDHPYGSNQNFNYENKSNNNKNNQKKNIIRRIHKRCMKNEFRNDDISPMRNLQAKKNAAVLADRAMVRELREKKAVEERMIQLKNEEKRREVQEKAKAREIERKEQMKRLKQEEKERQEKYKKLKPTFRIDRNVHYHHNTDSESTDSNFNSNSDLDYDEKRSERIKKRKEEETKKENLKRNAAAIAERMKNNPVSPTSVASSYENQEINEVDSNSNKKHERDISALREFLHQKRSEIKKNKQEDDIIMIGNIKYYVNNNNKIDSSEKNEINEKQNSEKNNNRKQIENDVYGLIFDNYKNNDIDDDDNNNNENSNDNIYDQNAFKNLEDQRNSQIQDTIENYSSEPLLTSESNNSSIPEIERSPQNNSMVSNDSNENKNDNLNTEENLTTSFESNEEFKSTLNNNNNPSMLTFDSNSPSSFIEKGEMDDQMKPISPSDAKNFTTPDRRYQSPANEASDFNYKKMTPLSSESGCSPMPVSSIKTPSSDNSPMNKTGSGKRVRIQLSSDYEYSPINSNTRGSGQKANENRNYSPTGNNKAQTMGSDRDYSPINNSNNNKAVKKLASSDCDYSPTSYNKAQTMGSDRDYSPINNNIRGSRQQVSADRDYSPAGNLGKSQTLSSDREYSPLNSNVRGSRQQVNEDRDYPPASHNKAQTMSSGRDYSPINSSNNNKAVKKLASSDCDYSPTSYNKAQTMGSDRDYSPASYNIRGSRQQVSTGRDYSPAGSLGKSQTLSSGRDYSPLNNNSIKAVNQQSSLPPSNKVNASSQSPYSDYSPVSISNNNSNGAIPAITYSTSSQPARTKKCLQINHNISAACGGDLVISTPDGVPHQNSNESEVTPRFDAANHKNTIIRQIDQLLNDSLTNSEVIDDEAERSIKSSPSKPDNNKNNDEDEDEDDDQKTEISISIQGEIECDDRKNDHDEGENKIDGSDRFNSCVSSPRSPAFTENYNFTFKGVELQFNNIKSNDSLAYKIETVRKFIEDSLGIDKSIKAYRLAEENNFANYKDVLTTPDQQSFYPLILQLVSSEEILLAKWLK